MLQQLENFELFNEWLRKLVIIIKVKAFVAETMMEIGSLFILIFNRDIINLTCQRISKRTPDLFPLILNLLILQSLRQ